MNIIYGKKMGYEIVPVYRGQSPVGFQVIKEGTGEVVMEDGRLCIAEEFLDSKREKAKTTLTDIVTLVNQHCEEE